MNRSDSENTPNHEQHVWQSVVQDVKPLRQKDRVANALPVVRPINPVNRPVAPSTASLSHHVSTTGATHPLPAIDTNLYRRIQQGKLPIERTLDLHELTQKAAYERFYTFLIECYEAGLRTVLVITGKGSVQQGGILRHALPRWCEEPTFRVLLSGIRPAHKRHGGHGAYYLRIKRHA